jgi:hypothetical protein
MTKNAKHAENIQRKVNSQIHKNQRLVENYKIQITKILSEIIDETDQKVKENQRQTQWTRTDIEKYKKSKEGKN